jgi:hypothetical protein
MNTYEIAPVMQNEIRSAIRTMGQAFPLRRGAGFDAGCRTTGVLAGKVAAGGAWRGVESGTVGTRTG